jgi:hypothetical protein
VGGNAGGGDGLGMAGDGLGFDMHVEAGPNTQCVREGVHEPGMASDSSGYENLNWGGFHGVNFGSFQTQSPPRPPAQRGRTSRVEGNFPELSAGSRSDLSDYDSEGADDTNTMNVGSEALKHAYRDETWSQRSFTYDPKPREFLGRRGTQKFFAHMPTLLQLFELFWPFNLLRKIFIETNRYATEPLNAQGSTRGGAKMGDLDNCRVESISGNSHVYGNETPTELQVLLEESRNSFPLSYHFQHHN